MSNSQCRHCAESEAIHSRGIRRAGLLRRFAPRNHRGRVNAFPRRNNARAMHQLTPEKKEGAGNAGYAARTRSLVCEWREHTSKVTTGEAGTPTFPARWFDRLLRALPGVHDLLVTVVRGSSSASLTPAQGCQDHAPLLYVTRIARLATPATSIASRLTIVTTRSPLFIEAGQADQYILFPKNGS